MAFRPSNHITGDSAVRKIASDLIPEEWTISIPDSDYGLDMLIEVVKDNKTTGKLFFIQSKGTKDSSSCGEISFSMSIERIRDYREIQLPVLFVYYSKTDNKFWGRWMNSLYNALTNAQKRQKTISLHFSSGNEIDVDYLRSIADYIVPSIPNSVSLICTDLPEQFNRFHSQVIATVKNLIGDDFTDDSRLSCKSVLLSYEGSLKDGCVEIKSGINTVCIPIQLTTLDSLYYPQLNKEDCPLCFLEIVFSIALFSSSITIQSIHYVLSHPQQEALMLFPIDAWLEFLHQISQEDIYNVYELFDMAVRVDYKDLAQFIILVVFNNTTDNKALYQKLLLRYLASECDGNAKGLLCYNLANSMRKVNQFEAFQLYLKAVQNEPYYRELFYWWQEVGGVLYLTGHYHFAELFYKKARRLSSQECRKDISILISDCLICQGKIEDAIIEESHYFETCNNSVSSVIMLKRVITEMMSQLRIKIFYPIFWFNKGVTYSREGNHKKALDSFLFAWRLSDGDIEALVNAFIESYNVNDSVKMALILDALRKLSPEEGYKRIVSILVSNNDGESRIDGLLDIIKSMFFSTSNNMHYC